jgi:hypothetical protein
MKKCGFCQFSSEDAIAFAAHVRDVHGFDVRPPGDERVSRPETGSVLQSAMHFAREHRLLTVAILLLAAVQVAIRLPPEYTWPFFAAVAVVYPIGIWFLIGRGAIGVAKRIGRESARENAEEREALERSWLEKHT